MNSKIHSPGQATYKSSKFKKKKNLKTKNYNNSDLNSNCQLPNPGDGSNFNTHKKKPVENVVITTKGLQDRNNLLLDGRTVENKGKLILKGKLIMTLESVSHRFRFSFKTYYIYRYTDLLFRFFLDFLV